MAGYRYIISSPHKYPWFVILRVPFYTAKASYRPVWNVEDFGSLYGRYHSGHPGYLQSFLAEKIKTAVRISTPARNLWEKRQ